MAIEPSVPSGSAMQVRAPDGRALRGMSFGPVGGKPVLFISGAATGSSMYFAGKLLSRANIRLLTMSRPGMEGSDPDPDRTLDSTVRDYETFAEAALGKDAISVPVVANSQGSVFGLGAALGGWASRLVLASPADEVSDPAVRAMLTEDATKLPDLANRDPQAAVEILRSFTAEAMESMVLNSAHDSDRTFYASDGFLSLYPRSTDERGNADLI